MKHKVSINSYTVSIDGPNDGPVSVIGSRKAVRAAMLSDLHDNAGVLADGRLESLIDEVGPDLILLSGDMVTAKFGRVHMQNALELIKSLAQKYPVYFVNGNHEERMKQDPVAYCGAYNSFMDHMQEFGVHVVNDTWVRVCINEYELNIGGLCLDMKSYGRKGRYIPTACDIKAKMGEAPESGFNILLAHHPDFFRVYSEYTTGLVLSGHLHGGLARLPHFGGMVGCQLELFPHYDKGIFSRGDTCMIVSAGLGDHTIPVRLNNPREVLVVDMVTTMSD